MTYKSEWTCPKCDDKYVLYYDGPQYRSIVPVVTTDNIKLMTGTVHQTLCPCCKTRYVIVTNAVERKLHSVEYKE